jgi:multiple sugar transport system permease protein
MGKAAAIAWVLFAIVFILTLIQMRWQRRWVHYETE